MGQFVEGCACNHCNKEKDKDEDSETDSKGDYDPSIYAFSRKEIPKNIVDVKFKTDMLVNQYFCNPFDLYDELDDLGEGAYGVVKKVSLKENPETIRAMKIIPKDMIAEGESISLLNEIDILKKLEHPNIVKIYECFFDEKHYIYIVSELCDQGDLLGKLTKLGSMSELVVKSLMCQILNAVSYLHDNKVFHGDIKLENIMLYKTSKQNGIRFTNDTTDYEVKLTDFGYSKFLKKKKHNKLSGIVGTSIYCSPEVIDNLYDERSDEWSCGVLMYILLCGEPPFQGETEEEIFANVKKGYIDFSKKEFKIVSQNCIDLIKKLLTKNKENRIEASEALKHPFFTENFNPMSAMTQNKDLNILKRLISLKKLPSKLHEVVLAYCCFNYITKEEEKELRELFRLLDHDNKNKLTMQDFERGFKEADLMVSSNEIKNIMNILDIIGNNLIDYQDFLRGTCDKKLLFNDENLKAVFGFIDKDSKGYATSEDIQRFVFGKNKKYKNSSNIERCMAQIGMKKDSKLTYEQFCEMIRNNTCLPNDEESDSNDSEDIDVFENNGNNYISSKNIIEKIENEKMLYNMTEGDEKLEVSRKYSGFHRINTTKA